jgi:beta-N-acetylhexosaminidase
VFFVHAAGCRGVAVIGARKRVGLMCLRAAYNLLMSRRDVRRHVGQLAIAGFSGYTIPPDLRLLAREFDLGGVIFFARNVESPEQVAELSREARELAAEIPLWVSVDQEGGRVARLKAPFTVWPPMLTLGRSGDTSLAARFARALATELKAVGISLDYTPVLDIHTNPKNPVIGDRALAERAEDVAKFGRVIIETLQSEGIAACGKHFPGHGDTSADSHHELPIVDHPPDRLEAVEFAPFREAVDAGVASIMTAHLLVPSLDEENPATLSPTIVGLLKKQLGFGGLVLSDDLGMSAISKQHAVPEATVAAIAAGCDAVLMCGTTQEPQVAALEAVIYAVEQGTLPIARVDDALARHRRVKERFLATAGAPRSRPLEGRALRAVLGRDEHQAVAAEMARFV